MIKIRDLDEFEDAELIKQKVAACFAGFIHDQTGLDLDDPVVTQDQSGAAKTKEEFPDRFEPGMIEFLPPGKDVKFGQPPSVEGSAEFSAKVLRRIAKSYGISYEALTGDFSQVNFSSARMGWIDMYDNISAWRLFMLLPQLLKPVWQWFIEAAIVAGHIAEPVPAGWTPPRREMIDPTKETAAAKEQVRCGFISRSEVVRQNGFDPDQVLDEIAEDNRKADAKKLRFDTDARTAPPQKQEAAAG